MWGLHILSKRSHRLTQPRAKTMTTNRQIAIGLLAAVLSLGAVAQPAGESRQPRVPEGAIAYRDLTYVSNGHERQKLDLYLPRDGTNLPLIINIHGGAFRAGSKEQGVPLDYLRQGYAVASINYRLSQHAKFPAQIEDCKAAVRWLRADKSRRVGCLLHGQRGRAWRLQGPESGRDDAGVSGGTHETRTTKAVRNLYWLTTSPSTKARP
jgi:acetyl esterase/lipase